jgi:hypothetical protein
VHLSGISKVKRVQAEVHRLQSSDLSLIARERSKILSGSIKKPSVPPLAIDPRELCRKGPPRATER